MMFVLNILERATNAFEKVARIIINFLLIAMVIIVLYGVFMRYILLSAVSWTEEAPMFMMVWLAFLAGGIGIKKGSHLGLNLFTHKLSKDHRIVITIISYVVIVLFLIVLIKEGYFIAIRGFRYQRSMGLGISMGWALLAVPFGAFFIMIESVYKIAKNVNILLRKEGRDIKYFDKGV